MTTAPYPQVSNELLSAYIDEAVSEEERRLIESAVVQDPDVAWRLESLRATVRLLHELPALSLPRSFLLTPEQVNRGEDAPVAVAVSPAAKRAQIGHVVPHASPTHEGGFWRGWMQLWQAGNPALRNAMAASFAALLVLLLAPRFLAAPSSPAAGEVQIVASQAPAVPRDAAGEASGGDLESSAVSAQDTARIEDSTLDAAAKMTGEAEVETTMEAVAAAEETTNLAAAGAPAAGVEAAPAAGPVEASDALFTTVPVAPAAQPDGATLTQSAGGASVLDDMQRQAGEGAPAAAAVPLAGSGAVDGAAQPASSSDTAVSSIERPAEEVVAEAATEAPSEDAAVPLPSPLPTATKSTQAVALEPAAGDQVEDGNLLASTPDARAESPAWLALVLQSGAWLAALATLAFGLLWWRSRPS